MLTQRDKDHKNHLGRQRRKEICLFELAGNLGTQRFCAVMFPLQLFNADVFYAAEFGCLHFFNSCPQLFVPVQHQYTTPTGIGQLACVILTFKQGDWQDSRTLHILIGSVVRASHCPWGHGRRSKVSQRLTVGENKEMKISCPLSWIHTSVIFSPWWTHTVTNTETVPSGFRRKPSSCLKFGCWDIGFDKCPKQSKEILIISLWHNQYIQSGGIVDVPANLYWNWYFWTSLLWW